MAIPLSSSFELNAQLPLDTRTVASNLTARDAIATIQRYEGLSVYVVSEEKTYQLQGGITNSDWVDVTGGGSSGWSILGNAGTNPSTNFIGTTDSQDLVFRTNNLERGRFDTNGNFGIGITPTSRLHVVSSGNTTGFTLTGQSLTGSDASVGFDLSATWNTTGSPSLIRTNVTNTASGGQSLLYDMRVGNSTVFGIGLTGVLHWGGTTQNGAKIASVTPAGVATTRGAAIDISGDSRATAGFDIRLRSNAARNPTSGISGAMRLDSVFNPTSGTSSFNFFQLELTVNQTGGANGITRGIVISPTLTSASDFRAFEFTNNTGRGLWGSGTANNALAGSLTVGSATNAVASAILEVQSTTRGFLPPRMTTVQRNAISSPASGLIIYNTTTNEVNLFDGTSWRILHEERSLKSVSGTTYTVLAEDNYGTIVFTNSSPVTVTLPNNLPVGFSFAWEQSGTGQVTFVADTGATLVNRQSHTKSAGQYAMGSLFVITNTGSDGRWTLAGDTAS